MENTTNEIKNRVGKELGFEIDNCAEYSDGFSFTVETELQAYKAAYKYRYCKRVVVSEAKNIGAWLVQIYAA